MKNLSFVFLFLLLAACSSSSVKSPTAPAPESHLDLAQLERNLNMDHSTRDLGMKEKKFNSCQESSLLPHPTPCRDLHLSVYHFQLVCRDTEGTVQQVGTDLTPIASTQLRWKMGREAGTTITDNEGYGQVRVLSEKSQKGQMFILRLGPEMLGVRAGEVRKFIVPKNWCS